jgi:hypothetical protein
MLLGFDPIDPKERQPLPSGAFQGGFGRAEVILDLNLRS